MNFSGNESSDEIMCPSQAIMCTRQGGLEEVEAQYRRERDGKLKERLNAIRLLMSGRTRKDVAEIIGVSESAITRKPPAPIRARMEFSGTTLMGNRYSQ
jgi:DNA-binding NarL/FixJ family response regulator